ncbi:MAG TPA: hypothetical protein VG537_10760, partial [Candidatus Kapabacteria bacterium]|nr:hypothetical protein [Candidatus Kapabacteria bacterium]
STVADNDDLGTLRGNLTLVNVNGDTLSNYAGATVQVEGTSFHAMSNATGDWQIDNVPAGIYNLLLTKQGFDTLIIPQYQFSGAGTSFVIGNAIQEVPMDSLVFSITNTIESTYSDSSYLGLLTMTGELAGSDSLIEARLHIAFGADPNGSDINTYLANNQLTQGVARGYTVPQDYKSGTVVTVWSSVWANIPKNYASYSHYQQSVSPNSVKRTFILP